jgi:hypothetical protein
MNSILDPRALDANRKGRLTLLQAIGQMGWVLFGAFPFLSGAAMFGWFIYSLIAHRFHDLGSMILGAIFNVGFAAGLMWLGYLIGGKLLIDMLIGQVRQIEGSGMKYSASGRGSGGKVFYYSVGELDFQIASYGTYKALHDAKVVRAYYLPRSRVLLNLESTYSINSYGRSSNYGHDEELAEILRLEEEVAMEAKKMPFKP